MYSSSQQFRQLTLGTNQPGSWRCHHFSLPIKNDHRSHHNIVFEANEETIEEQFLQAALQADIVGLQGHRSRGGLRASIYNAHTQDEVEQLCKFIRDFDEKV